MIREAIRKRLNANLNAGKGIRTIYELAQVVAADGVCCEATVRNYLYSDMETRSANVEAMLAALKLRVA